MTTPSISQSPFIFSKRKKKKKRRKKREGKKKERKVYVERIEEREFRKQRYTASASPLNTEGPGTVKLHHPPFAAST